MRRGRAVRAADRGSVTAEFATALPAVIIVLVLCLSGMQVAAQQVRLQDAAAIAARSVGRGEPESTALGRARQLAPGARLSVETDADVDCATLAQRASGAAGAIRLTLTARSCALGAGG